MTLSGESTILKQRRLELLREKISLLESFGLAAYRPHPKQHQFHAAGDKKRRMVRAGNRFGKSKMGAAEDCAWLLNERPWYPKGSPFRTLGLPQHATKGLVITTDFDIVDEVWTSQRGTPGKLWQMLPPNFVKSTSRNSSGVIDEVVCHNGSILRFNTVKSWVNDPQSVESVDYDFIHVDEPCPEKMWKAASRGLIDRNGSAWFTLTPLREVWINDMFFPRSTANTNHDVPSITATNRWAISGSTYDNPYLSKEAIQEFENSLSKDEKDCRINGIPLEFAGLIYKEFNSARHILQQVPFGWQDYNLPPKDYTAVVYIDPHPQTPHAVLFGAVSPLGQLFIYDEIFEQVTIAELSQLIVERFRGLYVSAIRCDPLAFIRDPITDTTIADEFANHGVFVEKAPKDLATGILKVKEALKKENFLYFSPHLRETLWEIERYMWDEKTNRPIDENDHMMENLYRMILGRPRWIDAKAIGNTAVEDMEFPRLETSLDEFNR